MKGKKSSNSITKKFKEFFNVKKKFWSAGEDELNELAEEIKQNLNNRIQKIKSINTDIVKIRKMHVEITSKAKPPTKIPKLSDNAVEIQFFIDNKKYRKGPVGELYQKIQEMNKYLDLISKMTPENYHLPYLSKGSNTPFGGSLNVYKAQFVKDSNKYFSNDANGKQTFKAIKKTPGIFADYYKELQKIQKNIKNNINPEKQIERASKLLNGESLLSGRYDSMGLNEQLEHIKGHWKKLAIQKLKDQSPKKRKAIDELDNLEKLQRDIVDFQNQNKNPEMNIEEKTMQFRKVINKLPVKRFSIYIKRFNQIVKKIFKKKDITPTRDTKITREQKDKKKIEERPHIDTKKKKSPPPPSPHRKI